ncbi:MAG: hypothetical protein ABIN13_17000 [Mucilaginibacter sp.]
MKLSAIVIFLIFSLPKLSQCQHIKLYDSYKLLSIDTVGPYYKLLMEGPVKIKDTITVLSLIHPQREIVKSRQWKLLKPEKSI